MIVTIAGIKRSGSTWLYNVVRVAYELEGYNVTTSGAAMPTKLGQVHIAKVHPYKKALAEQSIHVLTSYRNPSEILGSLERFNGKSQPVTRLNKMTLDLLKWQRHSDFLMVYERMKRRPVDEVERILSVLDGVRSDRSIAKKVHRKVTNIRPPKEGHDKRTGLFANHITRG